MFCTRCGTNNLDTDRFCKSCSAPLVKPGAAPGQVASSGPAQQSYPQSTFGSGQQRPQQDNLPYPGYQGYSSPPDNLKMARPPPNSPLFRYAKKLARGT